MTTQYIRYPGTGSGSGNGVAIYATYGSFPAAGLSPTGTLAVAANTGTLYEDNGTTWVAIASPGTYSLVFSATSADTPNTLVERDGSGNFAAGTITASLTGHASLDVPLTSVGAANGVAGLDSSGKVPVAQLPSVVMEYQGAWNPSTNTPSLVDGTGTNGNVYYVTALYTGTVSGLNNSSMTNFQIGDLIIYSAALGQWELVTPAAGVRSVNGAQGAVTVNAINQLTGDVVAGPASGSASAASTVAKIQGTTVSGTTGTGNVVFSTSPTLVTPALGIPSAIDLTHATALPLTSGVVGALPTINGGTGVMSTATFPLSGTIVTEAGVETLTNKQLNGPTIYHAVIEDYDAYTETTSAGAAAAGTLRVFGQTNDTLATVNPAGTVTQLGTGTGQKNYTAFSASSAAGHAVSGSVTVTTDTTAADLPRANTTGSGFKVTGAGSAGYDYVRFTLDSADYGVLLGIAFAQNALSGYTAGDLKLDVYSNTASNYGGTYTRLPLSTDSAGVSGLPNANFTYNTSFSAPNATAPYIEVRFTWVAHSTSLVISDLIVGPGVISVGPAVSNAIPWTPTGSWTTNTTYYGQYWQRGPMGKFYAKLSLAGAPTTATLTINMPTGLTIDSAAVDTTIYSNVLGAASSNLLINMQVVTSGSTSTVLVTYQNVAASTGTNSNVVDATHPVTWANTNVIEIWWECPIAQWSGAGLPYIGQNSPQYVSNSNSTSTASDTTSFAYGTAGSPIPNGATGTTYLRQVRFLSPLPAGTVPRLVVQENGSGEWVPIESRLGGYSKQNTTNYGASVQQVSGSSTDFQVFFQSGGLRSDGATFGATGTAWSAVAGWNWRLEAGLPGQAVGFANYIPGLAAGLVAPTGLAGQTNGVAVPVGTVGETSLTSPGSNVAPAGNGVVTNIVSKLLQPGVYIVTGMAAFAPGTMAGNSYVNPAVSLTSGSLDIASFETQVPTGSGAVVTFMTTPVRYINLAVATTVYLQGTVNYSSVGTGVFTTTSNLQTIRIA
jgi:hypothetical protein